MADPLARPRVRTCPRTAEWREAILARWPEATDAALSVLWAQFALETGRGSRCYNWNLGNRKARKGEPYVLLATWERLDGRRVNMTDAFAAFDTLAAGAADYLAFLSRPSYVEAFRRIEAGDATGFALVLHRLRYYTAEPSEYERGLRSLAREYLRDHARPTPGIGLGARPPEWTPRRVSLDEVFSPDSPDPTDTPMLATLGWRGPILDDRSV